MLHKTCYHCGNKCITNNLYINNLFFCCTGCITIYKIINKYNLLKYYELNKNPGFTHKKKYDFSYLDTETIYKKIISYYDKKITIVSFNIPTIHCSSCIWLLENITKIEKNIIKSTVNFTKKKINITYKNSVYKLSDLANLLTKIGYKPSITYGNINNYNIIYNNYLLYKIVISFFCFGNIMLLSFPEYLGSNSDEWFINHNKFFRLLMFILSIPIISFSSIDYFRDAFLGLKNKYLNIEIPISIGILVLFFRSIYEVIYNLGSGYFDSLSGLVFFLLLGKNLQLKTFKYLSFDNNYKDFYPIFVTKLKNDLEEKIIISNLKKGDIIIIKNEEIIPADSILIDGLAMIDNSFITGESNIRYKKIGDYIYAGAKQIGGMIKLKIIKNVDKSYLNNLWINEAFRNKKLNNNTRLNLVSKYFTIIILMISIISGVYWYIKNVNRVFEIISSILIVACPCGLALSTPFIYGNVIHILGNKGFYIRDIYTIERLSKITYLIFDKTGTITEIDKSNIQYFGEHIGYDKKLKIVSLLKNSNHPLCKILYKKFSYINSPSPKRVTGFEESPGKGIKGLVDGIEIKVGKYSYILNSKNIINKKKDTKVFLSFDKKTIGFFKVKNFFRKKLRKVLKTLSKEYKLLIMSGDNDKEKKYLKYLLPSKCNFLFFKSPIDKYKIINNLQKIGERVIMFGDGINDTLALKKSDVGIVLSNNNSFCPNCDIIMDARYFERIPIFLKYTKISSKLVFLSLIISIIYNMIGLSVAITGYLTPIISAILMPLSFISVLVFSVLSSWITAYKLKII